MIVRCEKCGRRYEDEFRLSCCPHYTFAANDGQNNFAHHAESFIEAGAAASGVGVAQEPKRTRLIAGLKNQ